MNRTSPQIFQAMDELDAYYQGGKFEDMPLSDEFLDCFGVHFDQTITPGGLPSPSSSNPDLPGTGRKSPLLTSKCIDAEEYRSQPNDGISDAENDLWGSNLLQQPQNSCADTGTYTVNSPPSTSQGSRNASNSPSKTELQQEELSQNFTATSGDSLNFSDDLFQSHAGTVPSIGSFESPAPIGTSISTQVPIIPKNTPSASVPANLQHSSTTKPQYFVRHPSQLRNQIHSEQTQYSPSALTATNFDTTGQVPHTMSSDYNFINREEHHASPSHSAYQNVQHSASRPSSRRINSAYNRSRGSPVIQNYQPFEESSLRTSATSRSAQNPWEAEHSQNPQQYPDPQPMYQPQFSSSPYIGHHHICGSQVNSLGSCSPEQYPKQSSDSRDFGFIGSSPMSVKRAMPSPDSDYVASSPDFKSRMVSSQPHKKQRPRQESTKSGDKEVAIDPIGPQTANLTTLSPTDHTNVAALIDAMHNTENVEDNLGMQRTWEKVRKTKAHKIRDVCVELMNLTKEAQRRGTPLGDKKPVNLYTTFEKRFDALCETLRFQKTVCKHLIEPPYSHGVVDDPQYAKDRVKNNRKVNCQKAEAIRLGREHMGQKGQGKGKPMLRKKKRGYAQTEDSQDDEDNSGDESLSDGGSSLGFGSESARPNLDTLKKSRPLSRSKYQPVHGAMIDTSASQTTNNNQHQEQTSSVPVSYLPQIPNPDDPFAQGLRQNVHAFTQQTQMRSDQNRMFHGFAASQRMPGLNQQCDFQPSNDTGKVFYGDSSDGNSGCEGLGGPSYGYI